MCHRQDIFRMTRPTVGKGLEAKINILKGEQAAWVRHLGVHPQTKTPNLDRLATIGVPFNKSHCAAPYATLRVRR